MTIILLVLVVPTFFWVRDLVHCVNNFCFVVFCQNLRRGQRSERGEERVRRMERQEGGGRG
jgi:hypothetical protein